MSKLAVVALGGNALLRGSQIGTIEEQEQNTIDTLENVLYLIKEGYDLVLSHGNGPQVGNILMRNDASEQVYNIAQMPLDICVADSQGGIGYMIERMLLNVLEKAHLKRKVVTLVTQVLVDKNDQAFKDPQKRVGKIYSREETQKLRKARGWIFKEEVKSPNGWRRVVPSPQPLKIMNEEVIRDTALQGTIVIASGGGGIPVYQEQNLLRPAEAVIDKDLASSLMAARIGADEFYMLTDVPYVYINYKKENQEIKEFLYRADCLKYLQEGMFSKGSMAPKIRAAIQFVEQGGRKSVITEATKLEDRRYGTKITLNYDNER